MAAAVAKYAQDFARSSGGDNTVWVDGATIAAGDLTAGKKYLIVAMGNFQSTSTTAECRLRLVRGSTVLCGGDNLAYEQRASGEKPMFGMVQVDTQPGAAEAIKVQIQPSNGTAWTVDTQVFALKLSDDFTENTDYFWNETTVDDAFTVAFQSGASVTFTPNGTDDYLVMGMAIVNPNTATASHHIALKDSVEGANQPLLIFEAQDATNEKLGHFLARVWTPSAAAHTFSVEYAMPAGTVADLMYSAIFALRLDKFSQHADQYTLAEIQPGTTFGAIAEIDPNPTVTGDWFVLAFAMCDVASLGNAKQVRLQVNAAGAGLASQPAYGDDAPDIAGNDGTNEIQTNLMTMISLTSGAAREINFDAQLPVDTTTRFEDRQLAAFSLELAGGAGVFSLDCQPGNYALTGTAASPVSARLLSVDPGSFAVTGATAGTSLGRVLTVDPGAYTLTGQAAGLLADRTLPADPGALTVTGVAATIAAGRLFTADPGSYTVTGIAATPVAGRVLSADPGSHTLSGVAAELVYVPTGGAGAPTRTLTGVGI